MILKEEDDYDWELFLVDVIKKSKGIVHVGAHVAAEADIYDLFGKDVFWIEASPEIFSDLNKRIKHFKNQIAINELITDRDNLLI